jgi:hypothetical protein
VTAEGLAAPGRVGPLVVEAGRHVTDHPGPAGLAGGGAVLACASGCSTPGGGRDGRPSGG